MKDRNVGIPIGIKHLTIFWTVPRSIVPNKFGGKKRAGFDSDLSPGDCSLDRIATSIGDELGGGNSNIFYFEPEPWGNDPF